jgi:hypothetical protein
MSIPKKGLINDGERVDQNLSFGYLGAMDRGVTHDTTRHPVGGEKWCGS